MLIKKTITSIILLIYVFFLSQFMNISITYSLYYNSLPIIDNPIHIYNINNIIVNKEKVIKQTELKQIKKNKSIKEKIKETKTTNTNTNKNKNIITKKNKVNKKNKVIIYIKDDLKNCVGITQILKKEIPFLIINKKFYSKKRIKECINIWFNNDNFEKGKIKRIINETDIDKINLLKRYYSKKHILFRMYNKNFLNLIHLYNIYKFGNINIYLDNNIIKIDYKTYKEILLFTKKYNEAIKEFIIKYNKLLKDNNIKQNVLAGWKKGTAFNNRIKKDGVKCGVYTMTLFSILNDYLVNKLILDKNTNNLFTIKYFKQIFNSIDKYRYNLNKKFNYTGLTNKDMINYFNNLSFGIGNNTYRYKVFYQFNIIGFLDIDYSSKISHSGFKICNYKECWSYFPDEGQIKTYQKYKIFLGKKLKVKKDIIIFLSKTNSLTF